MSKNSDMMYIITAFQPSNTEQCKPERNFYTSIEKNTEIIIQLA